MSKVLVTESHLEDIADAIREKLGVQTTYRPGDMAAAIESIRGDLEALTARLNGVYVPTDPVDGYDEVTVQVPTFSASVVADAVLLSGEQVSVVQDGVAINTAPIYVQKTITENGTYDPGDDNAQAYSGVVVNVQGGGSGNISYGTAIPGASTGADGDIYLQTLEAAIKNSAGQYINTGYHGNSNSKYVIRFMLTSTQSAAYATPFGARSATGSVTNATYVNTSFESNRDVTYIGWGTSQPQTFNFGDAAMIGKLVEMTLEAGSFKTVVDGTEYTYTFTPGTITDTTPIGIFTMLINGSEPSFGVGMKDMQLFMFDIYESGTLVHSYRPAKDGSDVFCLYDSIDQQYVYHSGGGTLQYIEEGTIEKVYLKQNGVWVNAIGAVID